MVIRLPGAWGLAILALLLPAALVAQAADVRSNPTGFHFGAMLNGSAITFEDDDVVESGPGASLALGWGVSRGVTLFIEGSGAAVEYADFDDTYTLGFLILGYSGHAAVLDLGEDLTIAGAGPTVGGGLAIFLNTSASLDIGLKWTGGSFTEASYGGRTETMDLAAQSVRLEVGLGWWAGGR